MVLSIDSSAGNKQSHLVSLVEVPSQMAGAKFFPWNVSKGFFMDHQLTREVEFGSLHPKVKPSNYNRKGIAA